MTTRFTAVWSRLRRPEYTGENRCWPCTVLNFAILLGVVVGLSNVSIWVAAVVAGVGIVAIWLQGYLVPLTPRITQVLRRNLPWNLSHTERTRESLANREPVEDESMLKELVESDVVRSTSSGLEVNESFGSAWYEGMKRLAELDDVALAKEVTSVDPSQHDATVHEDGDFTYIVLSDPRDSGPQETWIRRSVAIAETAAASILDEWGVAPAIRLPAAHALGMFLSTCPQCGSELREQPLSSCCGPPDTGPTGKPLQAVSCESCEVPYHVSEGE